MEAWKWGVFYWNREDPRVLVPKRYGWGWTFNFARPSSWVLLGVVLSPILTVAVLVVWVKTTSTVLEPATRACHGESRGNPCQRCCRSRGADDADFSLSATGVPACRCLRLAWPDGMRRPLD